MLNVEGVTDFLEGGLGVGCIHTNILHYHFIDVPSADV